MNKVSPISKAAACSSSVSSEHRYCLCGKRARVNTSWTLNNPGRRFFTCATKGVLGCNYFEWVDDDFSGRAMDVITHLNHRRIYLEEKLKLVEESLADYGEKKRILKAEVDELIEGRIAMETENKLLKSQLWWCMFVAVLMFAVVLMLR